MSSVFIACFEHPFYFITLKVKILDPSDKFRPEKDEDEFRNYTSNNAYYSRVKNTYYQMHTNQSMDYVSSKVRFAQLKHLQYI